MANANRSTSKDAKSVPSIEGLSKNEAITALISEGGMDFAEANKYWIENRPERGTGFKARFYAELEKGIMDAEAFNKFLEPESDNVKKNKANFDGVRKMANRIWELNAADKK